MKGKLPERLKVEVIGLELSSSDLSHLVTNKVYLKKVEELCKGKVALSVMFSSWHPDENDVVKLLRGNHNFL